MAGAAAAALASAAALAAELTPTEARWLRGAGPVLSFARQSGMPLDVVVQPQPTPDQAPLALAYQQGRCKLVLSMRGNAEAQATLDRIPGDLLDAALELMAAHELGHCRRYLDGAWFGTPSHFVASTPDIPNPLLRAAYLHMQGVRREEGYADLVGLAWTQRRHPQLYARLHAWLVAERSRDLLPGSHHDTLAWLRLVHDGRAWGAAPDFARCGEVWAAGLQLDP